MKRELLSRTECNALRGLAIIGIFLHNYCHWLNHIVQENEYQYFWHNFTWFNHEMSKNFHSLTLFHIISFFGHYGVPVFLFLSAYGLYVKYEEPNFNNKKEPSAISFIKYHWIKLFRMMIIGFVAFTIIDAITQGQHRYMPLDIIAQLGLFNNLLPNPDEIIWPGPYWYFGLMMQIYIVYRLILYRRHWGYTVGLIIICAALQIICSPESDELNRLRYNFIGGILPFAFGLLYAKFMPQVSKKTHIIIFIISLLAIYALNITYFTWYLIPIFVCMAAISFIKLVHSCGLFMNLIIWVGNISSALFICHPITRKIFIPISKAGDYWTGLILYIISSICLAWLFKELMNKIPKPKM